MSPRSIVGLSGKYYLPLAGYDVVHGSRACPGNFQVVTVDKFAEGKGNIGKNMAALDNLYIVPH